MIAQTDQRLLNWVGTLLDVPVSLSPPQREDEESRISIFLLDFSQEPLPRGQGKPPLQLSLRYLISAGGRDVETVHERLWRLLVEAVRRSESDDWSVERDPPPLALWSALQIPPRQEGIAKQRRYNGQESGQAK